MKEIKYKRRKNAYISSKGSIYSDVLRRGVNPILNVNVTEGIILN